MLVCYCCPSQTQWLAREWWRDSVCPERNWTGDLSIRVLLFFFFLKYISCQISFFAKVNFCTYALKSWWNYLFLRICFIQKWVRGSWDADSPVKNTSCSYTRPEFSSQHLYGGSQLSVTPVPKGPMPSSGVWRYQAHTWCTHTHTEKTPLAYKINNLKNTRGNLLTLGGIIMKSQRSSMGIIYFSHTVQLFCSTHNTPLDKQCTLNL